MKRPGLIRLVLASTSLFLVWGAVSYYFIGFRTQFFFLLTFFAIYFLLAYLFLPRIIYVLILILRRSRIPRYTHAPDGVLADPVNIILFGCEEDLWRAFEAAGWKQADPIAPKLPGGCSELFSSISLIREHRLAHSFFLAGFKTMVFRNRLARVHACVTTCGFGRLISSQR